MQKAILTVFGVKKNRGLTSLKLSPLWKLILYNLFKSEFKVSNFKIMEARKLAESTATPGLFAVPSFGG